MLSINIQHTSSRPRHLELLLLSLDGAKVNVITDDSGNTWSGCRKALEKGIESGADHILILQDDILVCKDFTSAVEKITSLHKESFISFFSPSPLVSETLNHKHHYCTIKRFAYAQAYSLPRQMAIDLLQFHDERVVKSLTVDDTRIAIYLMLHDIPVLVTAPNLVQHLCWDSSTTNREKGNFPTYKLNRRTTSAFIGLERSALEIDWTQPFNPRFTNEQGRVEAFNRYLLEEKCHS